MKIIVGPLAAAAGLVAVHRPGHVLSLVSPEMDVPPYDGIAAGRHLILRFHDIALPAPGLVAADLTLVQAMLEFGQGWDKTAPFLIHCWAGISRSTAAAFVLACQHGPPGQEQAIAEALRRLSPSATPNSLVVLLADQLLKRRGAMTRAIAGLGRGAEAALGTPFELPV